VQAVPISKYVERAKKAGANCDTCFLATDSMREVMPEFTAAVDHLLPGCRVVTSPKTRSVMDGGLAPEFMRIYLFLGPGADSYANLYGRVR
jgi:hypothetical protein